MGLAVVSLIVLVGIAMIAIAILIRVFGEAVRRNPNRPGAKGTHESEERDPSSGPGRE